MAVNLPAVNVWPSRSQLAKADAETMVVTVEVAASTNIDESVSYKIVVAVVATVFVDVSLTVSEIVIVAGRVAALPHPERIALSG